VGLEKAQGWSANVLSGQSEGNTKEESEELYLD
jgi:hypothetical protein